MGGIQTIDVRLEAAHAGWRLDRALAAAVPTLSRERLKTLIRSGAVETGGKTVRDPATKVRGEEALRVAVPEPVPPHNEPQDIPLTILFEDEHLLVVDQPAGLGVQLAAGNFDGTLVNALLNTSGCRAELAGNIGRPTSSMMTPARIITGRQPPTNEASSIRSADSTCRTVGF
jgi:23S rRNA pseudouridine1911/1915/1917 synthase